MSDIETMVTVYITKYALTTGIFKMSGVLLDGGYFKSRENGYTTLYSKKEYSILESQAHAQFNLLKQKKLLSLEKQKEKLLKMEFKVK